MVTLKEYEIYFKVKKFIQTENCEESYIIPQLINQIGILPTYIPLIIESDDMESTKFYSLSAAARGCRILKQMIVYTYRNKCIRIIRLEEKEEIKNLGLIGWLRLWINLTFLFKSIPKLLVFSPILEKVYSI